MTPKRYTELRELRHGSADAIVRECLDEIDELTDERDGLYDALDLAAREHDQKFRELASATGVAWEGKSHEEVVELVKALRPRTGDGHDR